MNIARELSNLVVYCQSVVFNTEKWVPLLTYEPLREKFS